MLHGPGVKFTDDIIPDVEKQTEMFWFSVLFCRKQEPHNLSIVERPRLLVRGRLLLVPVVAFRPVQNQKAIWTADC